MTLALSLTRASFASRVVIITYETVVYLNETPHLAISDARKTYSGPSFKNSANASTASGGHSRLRASSGVNIAHGALDPALPGIPASLHGSGVPDVKSSHRLSINAPYPSNCICAALFTAARTPFDGVAGGFAFTGRQKLTHSASAAGFAFDAHSAAVNAARASQNCGYPASGSGQPCGPCASCSNGVRRALPASVALSRRGSASAVAFCARSVAAD